MDQKRILKFLRQVMANNNREWFQEHKKEYEAVRAEFERGIQQAIERIITFDPEIAHVQVKDCTYRFYRDTRFSADKSPYKNHLGAYINAKGKKALRGGYYIHLEPDHCLLAVGNYWLPTNILTSCRNEMMGNTAEWLKCVESETFLKYFGNDEASSINTPTRYWECGGAMGPATGFWLSKVENLSFWFPKGLAACQIPASERLLCVACRLKYVL